jgi:hypothetical protein
MAVVLLVALSYGSCSIAAGRTGVPGCEIQSTACAHSSACCCQAQRSVQGCCCKRPENTPAPERSSLPKDPVGTAKGLAAGSLPCVAGETIGLLVGYGGADAARFFFLGRSLQSVLCIWRF